MRNRWATKVIFGTVDKNASVWRTGGGTWRSLGVHDLKVIIFSVEVIDGLL